MKAVVAKLPSEVLEELTMRLRPYWRVGNQVLAAVVGEAARRGSTFTFPTRWLASVRSEFRLEAQAEVLGGGGVALGADVLGFHLGAKSRVSACFVSSLCCELCYLYPSLRACDCIPGRGCRGAPPRCE